MHLRTVERVAIIALVVMMFARMGWVGRLEGMVYPVVGEATLEYVSGYDVTNHRATAPKYRECRWVKTQWFLGKLGGRAVQVEMQHDDPPKLRGVGLLSWDSISISLSSRQVEANSYALVTHDCYGGWLWETQSVFYNSR